MRMDVYLAMLPLKFSKVNDKIVKQQVQNTTSCPKAQWQVAKQAGKAGPRASVAAASQCKREGILSVMRAGNGARAGPEFPARARDPGAAAPPVAGGGLTLL